MKERVIVSNRWRKQVGEYFNGLITINCKVLWKEHDCREPSDFITLFTNTVVHEWVHYLQARFTKLNAYYDKHSRWVEYLTELMV